MIAKSSLLQKLEGENWDYTFTFNWVGHNRLLI